MTFCAPSFGDYTLSSWDIATGTEKATRRGFLGLRAFLSPGGQTLATLFQTEVQLWDTEKLVLGNKQE